MEKIVHLPYCVSCCGVLNFARWEIPLKMPIDETIQAVSRALIDHNLVEDTPQFREHMQKKQLTDFTCICCLNILRQQEVFQLCKEIISGIDKLDANVSQVMLDIQIPAAIEVCRVFSRFLIQEHTKPNPRFETVLEKVISWYLLTNHNIEVKPTAEMKVTVLFDMTKQMELCLSVYPDFRPKKQRKRVHPGDESESNRNEDEKDDDEEDLSQSNIDKVLIAIRSMPSSTLQSVEPRYFAQMQHPRISRRLTVDYGTVFVYGRYWKFVRDVPQSAWTISAHQEVNSHEAPTVSSENQKQEKSEPSSAVLRVGRGSVTEIVRDAVMQLTSAKDVLLHGCGREDIDVRCLGNGRPFVLQIIAPTVPMTASILSNIESLINTGEAFHGDIAVKHLQITTAKTWEIMQKEAEEKKKAYRCVCYSSRAISKEELYAAINDRHKWQTFAQQQRSALLENQRNNSTAEDDSKSNNSNTDAQLLLMDRAMVDEEGMKYLFTIQQATPLRVMHRRVLLERRRAIYAIQAEYLNDHFFLLSLVTGAGTYVKEFVHGDLGRTQPNVGSLLGNTQTEILQLDVIWLYDHFDRLLLPGGEKLYEEHQQKLHRRWLHRRKLLYAHQQSLKAQKAEAGHEHQLQKKVRLEENLQPDDVNAMLVDDVANTNTAEKGEMSSVLLKEGKEVEEEIMGEWLELPPLHNYTYVK